MPKGKTKSRYNFGYGAIYQRKTKGGKTRWYLDYRNASGKRIQELAPLAVTKEEARTALREAIARAFDREYSTKREKGKITFNEFYKLYLDNYAKVNKKSWKVDDSRLTANMIPFFGSYALKEITPLLIEKYRAMRLEKKITEERKTSRSTVNRETALLKKMFNVAIDWGHTNTNPMRKVKQFSEAGTEKEIRLTKEEEEKLLEACPGYSRPIIETALNTGMRKGEIFKLKWAQVDLNGGTITVTKTKSGKNRTIPINDRLNQILLEQKANNGDSPFVFPNLKTKQPFTDIKKSFNRACDKVGVPDLRFHDLRHTFATRLVARGVDLVTVRGLLGHSSVKITERYTHSFKDQKQMAVDSLCEKAPKGTKKGADLLHIRYTDEMTEKLNRLNRYLSVN